MIQNNPMVDYKQLYLNTVIINAAPAIDNSANLAKGSSYITINDKSFYSPVIRIISNGKVIYCSYKKK